MTRFFSAIPRPAFCCLKSWHSEQQAFLQDTLPEVSWNNKGTNSPKNLHNLHNVHKPLRKTPFRLITVGDNRPQHAVRKANPGLKPIDARLGWCIVQAELAGQCDLGSFGRRWPSWGRLVEIRPPKCAPLSYVQESPPSFRSRLSACSSRILSIAR